MRLVIRTYLLSSRISTTLGSNPLSVQPGGAFAPPIFFDMNIKQAKQYIEHIVKLYLKKDKYGDYRIPVVRQRPVFLSGAPGVGKTAIMEQIASELGIALVNYSMTHHTRQSALGLPFIVHKEYDGKQVDITEYTMSEIIASIYDRIESSGIREGILFLDEINCVSETLAPAMLQFLQFKTFGRYKVPEGWVIVTAGNPPEYNRSVREFDVVTLDRMKYLEVEADYSVWKEYASDRRLHGAVTNYLEINKDDFYQVETTVRGRSYVTARGWEDLSQIIGLYEEEGLTVDEGLIGQYLRHDRIVREFGAYYDLYRRYISDYAMDDILQGGASAQALDKARKAGFDERLSLVGIFTDRLLGAFRDIMEDSEVLRQVFTVIKPVKASDKPVADCIRMLCEGRMDRMKRMSESGAYSDRDRRIDKAVLEWLKGISSLPAGETDRNLTFAPVENRFNQFRSEVQKKADEISSMMDNVFNFCLEAFGEGKELILLLTEMTVNKDAARFLSSFGNRMYSDLSARLMINDPAEDLMKKVEELNL